MNARRKNKSHKVPNVKLRPAQPSSSASTKRSNDRSHQSSSNSRNLVRHSSPDNEPENTFVDSCPRPFKGVVLCATGIQDKTALFKIALELGAEHRKDLTADTTHLVADEHGGAKYNCALQMKIPILRSAWVTECHAIWKQGDDVDLRESITSHRLPILSELVIALSGVEDLNRQKQINRLVTYNRGIFVENIERPVKVTHLLCSGDEKTDKMKYAEKFNKSGEAHIKLVWEEWFWDCIHFGGRWPEDKYLVTNPRPEPKPATSPPIFSSPQLPDDSPSATPPPSSSQRLTHPFTIDPEEEEIAPVRKHVPHETLKLWENLLGPRGFEVVDGKLKRSPSKSQASQNYQQVLLSPTKPKTRLVTTADNGSILSNFKRTNSFAVKPKEETRRQPFTRVATAGTPATLLALQREAGQPIASGSKLPVDQNSKEGIFSGRKFRAIGEAKADSVKSVVEGEGGFWITDYLEDVDFIIVRLVCDNTLHIAERMETEKSKSRYRTECWLEKCIFEDRICDPDEHITFRPITVPTPLPGACDMMISFSGLGESEACWTRRFIRGIGALHSPTFSKKTTHLLCPSGQGPKAEKAQEWGIPIVDMSWLEGLLASVATSTMTEDGPNSLPSLSEDREEGAVEADSEDRPILIPGNSGGTDSNPQEAFLPADSSILPDFEFRTNNFLGRSTPKMGQLLKPEPTPAGDAESSSLYLSSAATHIEGWELVPSSRSPSPMVLKKSPNKEEEREERAHQVIAESIATLLGKRQASKEEVITTAQNGRVTKRSRPLSRNKSLNKEKELAAEEAEVDLFVFGTPKTGPVFRPVLLEPSIEDGHQSVMTEPKDDDMRVTYEDPRQREERQRLALLLGGKEESAPKPRGRRRSTRLAGF